MDPPHSPTTQGMPRATAAWIRFIPSAASILIV
jgi:hypothetical protein